jgi:hypothetical protein
MIDNIKMEEACYLWLKESRHLKWKSSFNFIFYKIDKLF